MLLTLLRGGAGPSAITGTLAAQETGADLFAGEGVVRIIGALSAFEVGSDVFVGDGTFTTNDGSSARIVRGEARGYVVDGKRLYVAKRGPLQ